MGTTSEPSDVVAGAGTGAGAGAEPPLGSVRPPVARRLAEPSILHRVRAALAHATARQVVGWALVVAWVVWLAALWVTQPRLVSQDFLAQDVAQGRVTAYRVVTVDEDPVRGPFSGPYRLDLMLAADDQDGAVDGFAGGRPLTVAYWVDSPVAGVRVLDVDASSGESAEDLVAPFEAAGVPEAEVSVLHRGAPASRLYNAGSLLLLASTLVVILGPRPRRGTRWFWFWLVGGPLAVGVPLFAVAELLRPRYEAPGTVHPPGVAGRRSGPAGFGVSILLSLGGGLLLMGLNALSPIWFIRG